MYVCLLNHSIVVCEYFFYFSGEKPDPSKTFQVSASQNFSTLCQPNVGTPQILITQPVNHTEQITPNPIAVYVSVYKAYEMFLI